MAGTLLHLYLRPAARLPVRAVQRAEAVAATGLDGDHAVGGRRQVTLLSIESWRAACREAGREHDPGVRRANLVVEGVDLGACLGKTVRVGSVEIVITGETRPCELMDDDGRTGLCAALRPDRRGGVYGEIRIGGELRIGDAVVVVDA